MVRKRFHGLKRVKVRQTWNKYNLYNLSRLKTPTAHDKTFFQQKWAAKSLTRAYHGEQVREGQWTRLFDRRIPAVVPMSHVYLGRNDGSEQAAGRGTGEDAQGQFSAAAFRTVPDSKKTPYMQMTFHPLERRLDTAIFRALFASSVRQARQYVVHGHVRVNGKKMIYPGYMLNPGDMFSVEPDSVLFATGFPKGVEQDPNDKELVPDNTQPDDIENYDDSDYEASESESGEKVIENSASQGEDASETVSDPNADTSKAPDSEAAQMKQRLKTLIKGAKEILIEQKGEISAKRKQDLRAVIKDARRAMSRAEHQVPDIVEPLEDIFNATKDRIASPASTSPSESSTAANTEDPFATLSSYQQKRLSAALDRLQENAPDPTKPYATPWRPRDYMQPFAFIPRYLEVNQNICSAVYLRHPVARPGRAEVPTPFAQETGMLAWAWNLRRR